MASHIGSLTFDCKNAASLAAFWAQVLGRSVNSDASESFAAIPPGDDGSPMMMFIQVPEAKSAKNRLHFDLAAGDRAAEIARLVALGATHLYDKDEWGITWSTLTDPEGNEFCVSEHLA